MMLEYLLSLVDLEISEPLFLNEDAKWKKTIEIFPNFGVKNCLPNAYILE